ncbi:hypothetical protein EQ500_02050, partial [Lactobacillus sp. XV13L]|nr:hypothetical protein [Lactobacillus sp. XV13L]
MIKEQNLYQDGKKLLVSSFTAAALGLMGTMTGKKVSAAKVSNTRTSAVRKVNRAHKSNVVRLKSRTAKAGTLLTKTRKVKNSALKVKAVAASGVQADDPGKDNVNGIVSFDVEQDSKEERAFRLTNVKYDANAISAPGSNQVQGKSITVSASHGYKIDHNSIKVPNDWQPDNWQPGDSKAPQEDVASITYIKVGSSGTTEVLDPTAVKTFIDNIRIKAPTEVYGIAGGKKNPDTGDYNDQAQISLMYSTVAAIR